MNYLSATRVALGVTVLLTVGLGNAQSPDPLYRSKGDHQRTYKFTEAGIDSPYRIYVPEAWDGKEKLPLVVILHGSRSTHDRVFEAEPPDLKGTLKREAEKHGFIIVAPEGYKDAEWGNHFPGALIQYLHPGQGAPRGAHRPDRPTGEEFEPATQMPSAPGSYPWPAGSTPPPPPVPSGPPVLGSLPAWAKYSPEEAEKNNLLSEKDVLNVIRIASDEYGTNPARLYLMGNSLGMIGTLAMVANHPTMFTAIGPSDGPIDPVFYPYAKVIGLGGAIIVHGEDDTTAPIDDSEVIAFLLREHGVDARFLPVAKGSHSDSWYRALPQVFDFFDAHPKRNGH